LRRDTMVTPDQKGFRYQVSGGLGARPCILKSAYVADKARSAARTSEGARPSVPTRRPKGAVPSGEAVFRGEAGGRGARPHAQLAVDGV
jgi:hypothetical protein